MRTNSGATMQMQPRKLSRLAPVCGFCASDNPRHWYSWRFSLWGRIEAWRSRVESDFNVVISPSQVSLWCKQLEAGSYQLAIKNSFQKNNVAFSVQQVIQTMSWFSNILNWVPQVKTISVKPEALTPIPGTHIWERKKLLKLPSDVSMYSVSAQMHVHSECPDAFTHTLHNNRRKVFLKV